MRTTVAGGGTTTFPKLGYQYVAGGAYTDAGVRNAWKYVPFAVVPTVANQALLFSQFSALVTAPPMDTSAVTTFNQMFYACSALKNVPWYNTSNVTNFQSTFHLCSSLQTIPLLDTSLATTVSNMFNSCTSLTTVPALNWTSVTNATSVFNNCTALTSIGVLNLKETFSIVGTQLNAAAINTLFTNLGTVSGKTVTITGVPGAATCDRSIATAKGWTVTG